MHQAHQRKKHLKKRQHFLLSVLIILLTIFTAQAQPTQYNEAPDLAQRVAAGELPPVEERLPTNPVIVPVIERIGEYGGTWRTALIGGGDTVWLERTIGYEFLLRWDLEWTRVIPNIAESFEVNEDATRYTLRLREGMRWSDGHPFTADDIMFWYDAVFMNDELTPVKPGWLTSGGQPVVVEQADDYTLVFSFAEPNGLFLEHLATYFARPITSNPRHYLEQFHIDYNPDNIDQLIREAGVNDWATLFQQRGGGGGLDSRWRTSAMPTLNAWAMTTAYGEGTRVVAERNPYYWKVDPDGNQLPYLDRVVFDLLEESAVLVIRALAGEIDMMDRHIATLENKATFIDNMERGNYRLYDTIPAYMNTTLIALNLTHKDPVKRKIFQNRDFRIGLSHAINRQEIIDLVHVSQGEPFQAAPRPEDPLYNERLAKQYTEYDPELANEYLDRAGYSQRDSEGFRLGPDGQRIIITLETFEAADTQQNSVAPSMRFPLTTRNCARYGEIRFFGLNY